MDNWDDVNSLEIKLESEELVIKEEPEEVTEGWNPFVVTQSKIDPSACCVRDLSKNEIKIDNCDDFHSFEIKLEQDELNEVIEENKSFVIESEANFSTPCIRNCTVKTEENMDQHTNEIKLEDELIIKDEPEEQGISDIEIRVDPAISSTEELDKIRSCYVEVMKFAEELNFIVQNNGEQKYEDDNCKGEESSTSDFDEDTPLSILKELILHRKNTIHKNGKNTKHLGQNNNLKLHKEIHTSGGNNYIKCQQCNKNFKHHSALKQHMLYHENKRHFKCLHCDKCYNQISDLKRHNVLTHENKKPFKCQRCDKGFNQISDFKRHLSTHEVKKPFKCQQCSKRFTLDGYRRAHMSVHLGKKSFDCQQCNKNFKSKDTLKQHMLFHENNRPFKCQQCGNNYKRKELLNRHMLIHERPFKCHQCSKRFSQDCYLRAHMSVHLGKKAFDCQQCNKNFKSNYTLKQHMLFHENERPFKCQQCGNNYKLKGHLNRHLLIHEDKRPFNCKQCDKSFKLNGTLKKHMLIHL